MGKIPAETCGAFVVSGVLAALEWLGIVRRELQGVEGRSFTCNWDGMALVGVVGLDRANC